MALVAWLVTIVGMAPAWADPIQPVGVGDFLPIYHPPAGSAPSLFEAIAPSNYWLDASPTALDSVTSTGWMIDGANALDNLVFGVAQLVVYAALALVQWIVGLTNLPGLNDLVATTLGTGSVTLMTWLGPTALAIGGLVAFAQRRTNEGFAQVLWVIVSMAMGLTLAIAPLTWVGGTQQLRSLTTQAVLAPATSTGWVSPDQQRPFAWPTTDYAGGADVRAMRVAGDATWRALVVVPWCVIEFGSIEACKKYGLAVLQGTPDDSGPRNDALKMVYAGEGDTGPTTQWTRGYRYGERGLLAFAVLIMNVIVCGLLLSLAFSALSALVSTALHLMLGIPFVLTWCIPGAPRRIGLRWLESLIGTIIQSALATGLIGIVLTLTTLIYSHIDMVGGIVAAGILAGATAFAAIRFRHLVEGWFDIMGGGGRGGAALLGAMALRMVSRSITSVFRGGRRGPVPFPTGKPRTDSNGQGGGNGDGSPGPAGPRGSSSPTRRRDAAVPRSRKGGGAVPPPAPHTRKPRTGQWPRQAPVSDHDPTGPQVARRAADRATATARRTPPPKSEGVRRPPRRTTHPTPAELNRRNKATTPAPQRSRRK